MVFRNSLSLGLILLLFCLSPQHVSAQTSEGPLGDLFIAKEGGLAHYSSYDTSGKNADFRKINPGETLVLVDHKGAGVVRRWWLTIAPRNSIDIQRSLIIRCYWDGEKEPSVEAPVSDFFGMGFGKWKDFISLPLNMTSGGYNSYWPMPFHRSARITVEHRGNVPITNFYYNIDIRTYNKLPNDALYFHAQYKQMRTRAGQPLIILDTKGRGHYVGTLLSMQPQRGTNLGYLEGDEMITIDGASSPSIIGTGTEDYFSSGWYYDTGEYGAPYHGVTIKEEDSGRINTYRWHIEDPIPFTKSFKFELEHGGTNDMPGVEYASVAFWYQTHPHPAFPPLPASLLPLAQVLKPAVEAESLLSTVQVTGGVLQTQDMGVFRNEWGNNAQLWWIDAKPGDRLTFPLQVIEGGNYELFGFFTRASDYGVFRILLNGKPIGDLVDGYNPKVEHTGPISFGTTTLIKGTNNIVVELLGKDARSAGFGDGYLVGIDGFLLLKAL
jgi:hypothetical protein